MARHTSCTDNGREFVNKHLFTAVRRLWTSTHLVQGRPRHSQDQGSVERANGDFKKQLFAHLMDAGKETNEWASELQFVQYSKNNAYHSGIKATPFSVHFERTPPDLSVDMLLPSEVLNTLNDDDQLEHALATRQVTENISNILIRSFQDTELQTIRSHNVVFQLFDIYLLAWNYAILANCPVLAK
ncbi:KRAB-A domain-containing protein 2-like [Oopsacas minuta]|uniref:KRAB-A domain-containing protein 2-like n=1 Tax=Oopsacas minuta TaxID=111878 RepID=A0AAV7KDG9_9METZ|nr:KRAB-A domain-containing protein 2-like [Oopsacas minuta]